MRGDRTVVPGWQNKLFVNVICQLVSQSVSQAANCLKCCGDNSISLDRVTTMACHAIMDYRGVRHRLDCAISCSSCRAGEVN